MPSSYANASLPSLFSARPSGPGGVSGTALTPAATLPLTFLLCLLTALATGPISRKCTKTYAGLSTVDRKTWCIGVVRGVFGLVLTAMAVPLYWCPVLTSDVAHGVTEYSRLCMAVLCGFFAFELASLAWVAVFYNYKNAPLWAHHALGMLFVGSVMYYESLHFFALTSCVQELSAPITSVSWMMAKCKLQKTWGFIGNHAALCAVWVLVRIGNDLHRLIYLFGDIEEILFNSPLLPLSTFLAGTVMLTFFLNPLWLRMKTKQLFKAIRIKLEEDESAKKDL